MADHRRRASPGGSQFTFAASPGGRDRGAVEYDAWAERIRSGNGYFGKSDDLKLGAWTRGASSFDGRGEPGEEELRWLQGRGERDGSGTRSPPLWRASAGSPRTEARGRRVDAETSPTSRARAIARYRQEMLEMVKDLPEAGYELSLRDIVVQPTTPPRTDAEAPTKGKASPEKATKAAAGKDRKGTDKGAKQLSRSDNMEAGGFLLRMIMPAALGGGRRRKSTTGSPSSRTKVSPRPSFSEDSDGEWWRNNELTSSGGSSDTSNSGSGSSSSTSSSNRSRKMNGCYHFLLRDKK